MRILESFGSAGGTLTVSEVARRSGLHVATASRLVEELVSHGLLERDEQRQVRVGVRLWELGWRASPTLGLREAAMPFMEDLHAVVGHHAQLGVLEGEEVLFVERLAAPGAVPNHTRVAGRLPLHASSSGLVLLAHAGTDLQDRIFEGPFQVFTEHTLDSASGLRAVLAGVRREGFALCAGHINAEATGIAVPLLDARGSVVAALSVIVPNDATARAKIPALQAAARGIARSLRRPPDGSSLIG
ncbi:MAG: IclR family transcriptional regulator [Nocardioidaceae bacterium]